MTNKSSNLVDVHIKNLRKKLGSASKLIETVRGVGFRIKETKAHYVSAECSACRMQLSEAMNKAQVETIFKNPLELIAEALKK